MTNALSNTRISGIILFAGIATLPLYLFPSGGLQISHALLAVFSLLILTDGVIYVTRPQKLLGAVAIFALFREGVAVVIGGGEIGGIIQAVIIAFNFLILTALIHANRLGRFNHIIITGLIVAAIVAILPIITSGFDIRGSAVRTREIGSFNNPNQLAYFAACLFSISGLAYVTGKTSIFVSIFLLSVAIFLTIVSLSKAALVGCGIALLLLGFVFFQRTYARVLFTIMVMLGVFYFYSNIDFGNEENFKFLLRLMDIGSDSDDNFRTRGYLVLYDGAENIFEILFGLGREKVFLVLGHEVHSTYVVSIMSYGLIGGGFYLAFLLHWILRLHGDLGMLTMVAIIIPPLLYGIAHNGTRFTIFYIMIGLTYCWTKSTVKKHKMYYYKAA
jgi:hypothetical protein